MLEIPTDQDVRTAEHRSGNVKGIGKILRWHEPFPDVELGQSSHFIGEVDHREALGETEQLFSQTRTRLAEFLYSQV